MRIVDWFKAKKKENQVRRHLQRLRRNRGDKLSAGEIAAITVLLRNQEAFDAFVHDLAHAHEQVFAGPMTDFLDWLLENGPAILELVLKIVSLFA